MTHAVITALLWFLAVSCGLIAGLYFALSTFVMSALGRIETQAGNRGDELDQRSRREGI